MSNILGEDEFLKAHSQEVYNLCFKLIGNAVDAEDLAQEVLIKALRALPKFKGESSPSTWLYRITMNAWKNFLRSKQRRGFWSFVSLDFFSREDRKNEALFDSKEPPLDHEILKEEKGVQVTEALLSLNEQDRAIVLLRDIEEKSYQEIAAIMNVPEGTV